MPLPYSSSFPQRKAFFLAIQSTPSRLGGGVGQSMGNSWSLMVTADTFSTSMMRLNM